ncbi:MAG: ABC transporter permease [Dehalococcoidia bacterium]|nr:ABC transporter permease [Dehalococcoidia bacterium]
MPARPDVSIGAFRVWQRSRDVLMRRWKTEILGMIAEPFIVIFALGLGLGRFVELGTGQEYVVFLGPGLLALFPMFAAVFECAWGSFVRLEMQGTYDAIIATPVSVDDVITGEILWGRPAPP